MIRTQQRHIYYINSFHERNEQEMTEYIQGLMNRIDHILTIKPTVHKLVEEDENLCLAQVIVCRVNYQD